jgi:hypothetical protein
MEVMKEIYEALRGATFTLPAIEVSALIVILALCLVFRYSKTGLITGYIFAYRWGWMFITGHEQAYLMGYLVFGIIVGALAAVQFMWPSPGQRAD